MTLSTRRSILRAVLQLPFLAAAPAAETRAAGFPVTVAHALGSTRIAAAPRRVVSLGYNDHDFLYALGIAPVAVTEWWGNRPYATWPWAEERLQALGAFPAVAGGRQINLEWVLSQQPDLIVATYRDLDADTYAQLSKIAPVIAHPQGYDAWSAPWQVQLRLLDRATSGTTAGADRIIGEIDAGFAAIRQRYPALAGKSASLADMRDGQFLLWSRKTASGRFLAGLGCRLPEHLEHQATAAGWIHISFEKAGEMDLDAVLWPNGKREDVEAVPTYRRLRLFRENRSIWLDDNERVLSAALWFQSPLSIRYAAEPVARRLAQVLSPT